MNDVEPPKVSFEFFPPATAEIKRRLWKTAGKLARFSPSFVSVTYGAGGSTRARTHEIIARLQRKTPPPVAAHLTCIGASRTEIKEIAAAYWNLGVRHIVALRGDRPPNDNNNSSSNSNHPDGYTNAAELTAGLRTLHPFEISVGAYPETHPEAQNAIADINHLRHKIDQGASRAITQFFFDVEIFLRFRDRCTQQGIKVPIVPGILPIVHFGQLCRFAASCGTSIPDWLHQSFNGLDHDPEARNHLAASIAIQQCQHLLAEGVRELHFYTLNHATLCETICTAIGLPQTPTQTQTQAQAQAQAQTQPQTQTATNNRTPPTEALHDEPQF